MTTRRLDMLAAVLASPAVAAQAPVSAVAQVIVSQLGTVHIVIKPAPSTVAVIDYAPRCALWFALRLFAAGLQSLALRRRSRGQECSPSHTEGTAGSVSAQSARYA